MVDSSTDRLAEQGQGLVRSPLPLLDARETHEGRPRVGVVLQCLPVLGFAAFEIPFGNEDGRQVGMVERRGGGAGLSLSLPTRMVHGSRSDVTQQIGRASCR